MSDSLWPHGLQHANLHHLPEFVQTHVHWVGVAIQPSNLLLSPSPQYFPASGSFPMSWFFASGGQSIVASASASVLPMNIQGWIPLELTDLILQPKGHSGVFSSTTIWNHQFFNAYLSLWFNPFVPRSTTRDCLVSLGGLTDETLNQVTRLTWMLMFLIWLSCNKNH